MIKTNKVYLFIIAALVFVIIIILNVSNAPFNISDENAVKIEDKIVSEKDSISVPCLENQVLSDEKPFIYLNNPDKNDVYFIYEIGLDGKILHTTDAIPPDHTVKVNLYDKLEKGKYHINLKLKTYDVKTKAESNGVNSSFEVVVK